MLTKIKWHVQHLTARLGLALLKASGAYDGYWQSWRGALFDLAERRGLHILPVHYYSPVPNVAKLDSQIWAPREHLFGIDLRLDEASRLLADLAGKFAAEYNRLANLPDPGPQTFRLNNAAFGPGDAEIYYAVLRHLRPRRVVEIGCGHSTLVASKALQENRAGDPDYVCDYLCIEPYLPDYLEPLPPGITRVIRQPVQSVPLQVFEDLGAGDILFIDSTHVAAIGSDVVYEYLEILPRLRPGVVVHIHDIFLPRAYPQSWLTSTRFFWNEQYLLHAYLLHNRDCEVILPMHALFSLRQDALRGAIPSVTSSRVGPSSFWMRVV